MDVFTVALSWLTLGIAVLPIAYRTKLPDARALRLTGHTDSGRASWLTLQHTLPTEHQVKIWTSGPRVNLAVVTGWQGLVVLDFDTLAVWQMYQAWLADTPATEQLIDQTYKVETGRGIHVYIGVEEPVRNGHLGAIDIKAAGGYVLTPPSIHPSRCAYRAIDAYAPVCTVERLTDVFPFEYSAANDVQYAAGAAPALPVETDPFVSASRSQSGSLIAQAKTRRLEDFFGDLLPTGNGYYLTCCPFHQDAHPSFWLDTRRQLCGCLAGCTAKPLDVINFYARRHGLSNRDAALQLARSM